MSEQPTPSGVPSAPASAGPSVEDLAAVQEVLAGEHAAVYLYALVGARTSESRDASLFDSLRSAYAAHRDLRDQLLGLLADAGAQPVAAAAAYALPVGPGVTLETAAGVTAAAALLESACAATSAAAVGQSSGEVRRQAVGWLNQAAARELVFRGTPEMFPGADEQADR